MPPSKKTRMVIRSPCCSMPDLLAGCNDYHIVTDRILSWQSAQSTSESKSFSTCCITATAGLALKHTRMQAAATVLLSSYCAATL